MGTLVCCLQAYVFCMLSSIYIGMGVKPTTITESIFPNHKRPRVRESSVRGEGESVNYRKPVGAKEHFDA